MKIVRMENYKRMLNNFASSDPVVMEPVTFDRFDSIELNYDQRLAKIKISNAVNNVADEEFERENPKVLCWAFSGGEIGVPPNKLSVAERLLGHDRDAIHITPETSYVIHQLLFEGGLP